MNDNFIKAIGNLLQFYHSDLQYILDFQRFKISDDAKDDYLTTNPGTFKSFLNEFKIARNFKKEQTRKLLLLTMKWINRKDCDNVDEFANYLRKHNISDGKLLISLSSKILFLNNPWKILPYDKRTRMAVGLKENSYSTYQRLASQFRKDNRDAIDKSLTYLKPYLTELEKDFKGHLFKIEIIRENRLVDKLLWTIGGNTQ